MVVSSSEVLNAKDDVLLGDHPLNPLDLQLVVRLSTPVIAHGRRAGARLALLRQPSAKPRYSVDAALGFGGLLALRTALAVTALGWQAQEVLVKLPLVTASARLDDVDADGAAAACQWVPVHLCKCKPMPMCAMCT